jgi:ABC-2 type transport system ATP-binding protein
VRPGWATEHARIGYLPGDFRMWPRLRARAVLKILAAPDGRDRARTRRAQLAERLDLDLSRRVGEMSKGNRQKVGVVYALQHQPDVLILDEPTIGLDPLIRQAVLDLLREAAEAGAAVLLSSHDLSEVAAVCGRAAILREGRLVELAPVSEIVQQSEHRLKVWFSDQTLQPPIPTERVPQIRVVDQQPGALEIAFRGASVPILQWIAQLPVDRISTPQMSLEEAFMQYYRTQRDAASNNSHDAASCRGQR